MKALLALTAASLLLITSGAVILRSRDLVSTLLCLGIGCLGVMALTHVFESFSILPALGWGQPRSVGHFIDLGAAVLGVMLLLAGLMVRYRSP